jgi:hypothetical protein
MKKNASLLIFFLIIHSFDAFAQNMSRVKSTIDTLTSPDFQGRGYVNNGNRKAADFIASRFQQYGLKKFSNNYFQSVKFNVNVFPNHVELSIDGKKLQPGKDFIVNAISGKGQGKAEIMYFDTLMFISEAAKRDFMMQDVTHKVIAYRAKDYAELIQLPVQYLHHVHEAMALIEIQDKKLTASIASNQLSHPTFEVYQEALPTKAKKAKYRLDAELIKSYPSQNVIGYVEGKVQPDSFIVISAHYDHLGRLGKKTYFPGANDNASGVAILLELADYFAKPENQPDCSMAFIAFTGEEIGLLGSKYYVQNPVFPLSQIKLMINMDMVGTGDEGITIVNTVNYPQDLEKFQKINQEKNYLPKVNRRANAPNSDHFFFANQGVKAFFIYTLGGIKAYHDMYDRPETLPLTKFEGVFNLVKDYLTKE